MEGFVEAFERALLSLDRVASRRVMTQALERLSSIEFAERVVGPALDRIGQGWQEGSMALSQVYMSGRLSEALVDEILPPADPVRKNQPRMAIVALRDHHLLGKRIVCSLLRASGFDLLDYRQMDVDELVARVRKDQVRALLISTLMLSSALKVSEVRARLDHGGPPVRLLVGGAPFRMDANLWREVGADGMGRTASEAVGLVARIVEELS